MLDPTNDRLGERNANSSDCLTWRAVGSDGRDARDRDDYLGVLRNRYFFLQQRLL
jgi:hypothetical protein